MLSGRERETERQRERERFCFSAFILKYIKLKKNVVELILKKKLNL
jgi:hypothetical protein